MHKNNATVLSQLAQLWVSLDCCKSLGNIVQQQIVIATDDKHWDQLTLCYHLSREGTYSLSLGLLVLVMLLCAMGFFSVIKEAYAL